MPRRPVTRAPLTRERIVDAALALIDNVGLDALSMRRLGEQLGVEAMSLYKHLPDKAAIVDAVIDRVLGELSLDALPARWDDRLRFVADEMRRIALAHPAVFARVTSHLPASEAGYRMLDVVLAALVDAGLDDAAAVHHFWALIATTNGALLGEVAALTGQGDPTLDVAPTVPADAVPTLTRFAARLAACDFATEHRQGIEIHIDAIRAEARRRRRAGSVSSPAR